MPQHELCCMNCNEAVPQGKACFFAEVFLCTKCHQQATHFWLRLDRELRSLQVMAKDSIRQCLLEGKFVFPEVDATAAGEVSKRAVLETILTMEEARAKKEACTRPIQTHPSSGNTPPNVPTLGALVRSNSPKGSQHS